MRSLGTVRQTALRTTRGWLGIGLAAAGVVAGAAFGAHAASAPSDPHGMTARSEADRILTTFVAPPGSTRAAVRPDPLPPDLGGPPIRSGASTRATSIAWYYTSATPGQVLAWVAAHPPAGAQPDGSGGGSAGPDFESFQYPTPHSKLIVTPEAGADGRTVIRLDAEVIWTPSRSPDSRVASGAPSVTVVTTNRLNPQNPLPAAESEPLTSTDPATIQQVTDLLNALTPPIPGIHGCPMDDGTEVAITLPGHAQVALAAGGCGTVRLTVPGQDPQTLAGGGDLVREVYALFGVAWRR
ncbi:MAG: hypothetical protein HOV83_20835 [Catenulispora sp.]|nr:hypothetical protein [Catenulispora sp.]